MPRFSNILFHSVNFTYINYFSNVLFAPSILIGLSYGAWLALHTTSETSVMGKYLGKVGGLCAFMRIGPAF